MNKSIKQAIKYSKEKGKTIRRAAWRPEGIVCKVQSGFIFINKGRVDHDITMQPDDILESDWEYGFKEMEK